MPCGGMDRQTLLAARAMRRSASAWPVGEARSRPASDMDLASCAKAAAGAAKAQAVKAAMEKHLIIVIFPPQNPSCSDGFSDGHGSRMKSVYGFISSRIPAGMR